MYRNYLKSNICFILVSIVILTICLLINPASKLSEQGISNFDWWSNDIMIADLIYNENFENDSLFQKVITPPMLVDDEEDFGKAENIIKNKFFNNETFSKELFGVYTSNITAHRFIYRALNKIPNLSNEQVISIIETSNCLLMAIMIAIILYWIKNITNITTAYILLFILGFIAPSLTMIGKNLYWVAWSLFLPMVSSILIINSKKLKFIKKRNIILFFVALITCLIKQLFYFEFITTVMISMMIPIIYYIISEKLDLKEAFKIFIWMTMGALISFVIANLIKLMMLSIDLGTLKDAINVVVENLNKRILGNENSLDKSIAYSATVSLKNVLLIMGLKTSISIKGVVTLTQLNTIGIMLAITILESVRFLLRNRNIFNVNLLVCSWISLLAPLSWFILAKPHTYIHNIHCSMIWFIPFNILAYAFIIQYLIEGFGNRIKE